MDDIEKISNENITIETIEGNDKKDIELIIIPGFSTSSYDRNFKTLFEYYDNKINKQNYNKIHLIKFQDDDSYSIKRLHDSFFNSNNDIEDPNLENNLYEKCAEIIQSKLNSESKYIVLAKSAGGGVGIYLSKLLDEQVKKLYLFAPGIKYLNSINIDESKIIIGWNKEDTKVKMSNIKPIINNLLPSIEIEVYSMNIKDEVDTQHEINSQFIKKYFDLK